MEEFHSWMIGILSDAINGMCNLLLSCDLNAFVLENGRNRAMIKVG